MRAPDILTVAFTLCAVALVGLLGYGAIHNGAPAAAPSPAHRAPVALKAAFAAPGNQRSVDSGDAAPTCGDASTWGAAACGRADKAAQEAKLTTAWKRAYGSAPPEIKPELLKEQRLWIQYKDAACAFFGSDLFGSNGWSVDFYQCTAEVIAARTQLLTGYGDRFASDVGA